MQQIYRRIPMPMCNCNFTEITLWHWCSPVNLLHIFRTTFSLEDPPMAASVHLDHSILTLRLIVHGKCSHKPLIIPLKRIHQRCSIERGVFKISQNSPENTCAIVSFLIKLQAVLESLNQVAELKAYNFRKKRLFWHRCFRVNFGKFLRTPFL